VVDVIGRGEHFAFIDVINLNRLQNLCFHKVSDPAFGHHRDGYSFLDAADHVRVAHAGDTAGGADVRRDAFQRHHRTGAGLFGDFGLLGGGHIHNHPAFEHLGQITVQFILFVSHFIILLGLLAEL